MAKAPKEPTMSFSVRLMRDGKQIEDCLRGGSFDEIPCAEPEGGRLFTYASSNPPSWLKYVKRMTNDDLPMINRSSSAILFLSIPQDDGIGRLTATTFGNGHHAIDPEAVERDFGLRVVLNSVPRGEISSIDAATPDATTFQRRVQASRNSDISAFGMDVERDLLRVAAGTPADKAFASFVAGRDALTLQSRIAPKDLPAKLKECLRLSKETVYQADFEWVDNVRRVKEKDKIDSLDVLVLAELDSMRAGNASDMHMSPPEIYDYTEGRLIAYYGPSMTVSKTWYPQLDISNYVSELDSGGFDGDVDGLKSHMVHVHKDEEASPTTKWSVYECFVWEVDLNERTYVLFAGGWYQIDEKFAETVERDLKKIMRSPGFIAVTNAKNEKEFIKEVEILQGYINLDQTKLSPGGVKGANIEFSDFLSRDRKIIHLKDGHSSSAISHLWNQGLVCGDALSSDSEFRKKLRAAVRKREKDYGKQGFVDLLPAVASRVDTSQYTIVYGILRRKHAKSGKLDIPFFSKISLRPAARQLAKLGYGVELHIVEKVKAAA